MRTTPYVAFSVGYALAFVYAFSSFANFGLDLSACRDGY
jgi:hypothetical protein